MIFYNNLAAGLIFALALTLLFDSVGEITLGNLPDITPGRLAFCLLVSLFAIKLLFKEQRLKHVDRVEWLMLLLCSFCLVSMWQAGTLGQFNELLSQFLLPFTYFLIAKNTFDSEKKVFLFLNFAFAVGVYASLMGILEHLGFHSIFIDPVEGPGRVEFKESGLSYVTGILRLPAATGTFISFCLIMSLYKNGSRFSHWITSSALKRLAIIPMAIAIFLCYERSVYAGIVGALFVLALLSGNLRRTAVVGLLSICALVIVNWSSVTSDDRTVGGVSNRGNINFRLVVARTSLAIFADHPVIGAGFGTYHHLADKYLRGIGDISYREGEGGRQHNTFLGISSELGGIGIILFGLLLYFISKMAWTKYKMCPPDSRLRQVITIFFGIGVIYFINANCYEVRYFELINDFVFVFAGIIAGYTPADGEDGSEAWQM